ncbi:MAG: hypothetical protein A3D64_00600 [Candidatus Wildermuthbacteria bacterium RIFCSPHIGHO2_02_FULL_49_9]|uniref:Triosephosphate isomerase n=2 Tax=Candidatus Wildermuthiibacteriota TaxID=1817923 RepID=A0A1G2QW64_9BACT|nr:MAG: hypothetical protein A2672_01565 [Candidatus Wildermuthbacteria bacterium RIFCSPHIGHO2_01_FULL_49_22b]OHA70084.1 MAG: hypothetical protein A3D64_00600 [Candidatus Wildermuthbacteria bacterium RIFCSPHIGHO2_02_FULL_49_9]
MNPIIVANWKMNPQTLKGAFELTKAVRKGVRSANANVVLCPPYVFIPQLLAAKNMEIGAQNCSWQEQGPLTGEVSPRQLKDLGCSYVILGHSERKKELGETLAMVQRKVAAALTAKLRVILCVESVAELRTLKKKVRSFKNVAVVYEPSFAISTQGGRRVAPRHIAAMVSRLKKVAGRNVPVLYGGSVDAKSMRDIMTKGNVQGALVGAASLKAKEFIALVKNAL